MGVVVSLARIASGAHFFSDTIVSFFVMLIVADLSYFYLVLTAADRDELVGSALKPAYVALSAETDAAATRVVS